MGFKTKELIFIALMAALLFVANFALGSWIIATTGIPGSSAFLTGVTNLIAITFIALVFKRFWSVTLMYTVYGLISLPTYMNGGPPGFIPKIFFMISVAIILDLVLYASRYKKIGFIIGLPVFVISGFIVYLTGYYLLGMPEFEKMYAALIPLTVSLHVLGYLGIWLGYVIYNKLKNKKVIRQITA